MSSEQAVALWKAQLPLYNRILQRVKDAAMAPLVRFVPPSLQQKQMRLRELLEIGDVQNYQEFFDVICEHVEGVKNKSTIELADLLVSEFGGQIKFWQNAILDVAQYTNYAGIFNLWHIRKVFQHYLFIDAEHLSKYRMFTKLAKKYLVALTNIIKSITKFDEKKDCIAKIDELYKKVKSAEEKYLSYSEHFTGLQQRSGTMDELSNNMTQASKKNAIKDLFNFAEPKKPKHEKAQNTLLNYKFTMGRPPSERVQGPTRSLRLTNNKIEEERLNRFQFYFNHLRRNNIEAEELRKEFEGAPQRQKSCHSINLTTIWDKDYYFSYFGHPIEVPVNLNFVNPIEEYSNLNYSICSDDEFQQLLGEDVENCSEFSSVSELSHAGSFIVSDDHVSDDQDQNKQKKQPQLKIFQAFGSRWGFSKKDKSQFTQNKRKQFKMVCLYKESQFPLPTSVPSFDEDQVLMQLVDGKDRKQIQEAIDKKCLHEKIKITKGKIDQFLKKKCLRVKSDSNSSRYIYKLAENDERTNKESLDEQKSKKSGKTNNSQKRQRDKNEPDTEQQKAHDASFQDVSFDNTLNPRNLRSLRNNNQKSENVSKAKKLSPRVTRNRSKSQKSQRSTSQSQQKSII